MELALSLNLLWPFSASRNQAKPWPWPMRPCCAGKAMASTHQQKTKEKKVEMFAAWLEGMGHDPCNLLLHNFPSASATPGFGTTAGPGGIRKGQVVVQVPLQAFMSEHTAHTCPHVGPLIKSSGMTAWQGLCLHLLFERAKGVRSTWYPYLALLPTELEMVDRHPLMWPPGRCQEWLAGSPMLSRMEQRFSECKEDYEVMLAAGENGVLQSESGNNSVVTEALTRWAASILLSRAFSLDLNIQELDEDALTYDSHTTVLVPWADMLNHSSSAGKESCLVFDSSKQVACLSAHKSYEKGDQVFDSYGPNLSPSQLLLDYGFVDDKNKNYRVDLPGGVFSKHIYVVDNCFQILECDEGLAGFYNYWKAASLLQATYLGPIGSSSNKALLNAIGLPPDGAVFSITEAGVDDSVLAWTRAAVASTKELADAGWSEEVQLDKWVSNKAASSMAHFHQPVSQENESEALRRLLSACGTVLTQYPTSLDEDLGSLDTNSNMVNILPWAQVQAQRALISEKTALRAAWKHLYVLSKSLEMGVLGGKPKKKKGKKELQKS